MGASAKDRWDEVGAEYEGWLSRQPLSANTKRTYRTRVSQFLEYLAATPAEYGDPLDDLHARDYAMRDYKGYLKTVRKAKPSSVNLSLAARGRGWPRLPRGHCLLRSRSGSCERWSALLRFAIGP